MNYQEEEESRNLIASMSAATSTEDFFKNENESVDMLLREINQEALIKKEISGVNSVANSPIKPLNFPQYEQKLSKAQISITKDFNSSSDTYISEQGSPKNEENVEANLFIKNFEDDLQRESTSVNIKGEYDDKTQAIGSIGTTCPVKLEKGDDMGPAYDEVIDDVTSSPNKSIMKKANGFSPKKNVAFASSSPEVHQYETSAQQVKEEEHDDIEINSSEHNWNELGEIIVRENLSPPPLPPLHKINEFTNLIGTQQIDEHQEMDLESLRMLKQEGNSFSSIPLNERLDVYLTKHDHDGEVLFEHLDDLTSAVKNKSDSTIHNISYDIRSNVKQEPEDPLVSLSHGEEVGLRSAGSSQSSLQSLLDDNRQLNIYYNMPIPNKGLEVNDGINGFSDQLMSNIIEQERHPHKLKVQNGESGSDSDSDGLTLKATSNMQKSSESEASGNEIFHDSFDTNTELSIMKLLVGTNNKDDNENRMSLEASYAEELSKGKSGLIDNLADVPPVNYAEIVTTEGTIKPELEVIRLDDENDFYYDYDTHPKIEFISDYGVQKSDAKLIKDRKSNVPTPEQESIPNESSDLSKNESQNSFTLRDHLDSNWKFEDSNDGDQEDNGDSQIASHMNIQDETTAENHTENDIVKNDKYNLTADESHRSLAPPPISSPLKNNSKLFKHNSDDVLTAEEHVLANSSNVAPPDDISLPSIKLKKVSSLKNTKEHITALPASYEDLFSVENEPEKPPSDYLSIWHSQKLQRSISKQTRDVSNGKKYKIEPISQNTMLDIPHVQAQVGTRKRFKEINVLSRRVLSSSFDDGQVSAFLPEISEDSGLSNPFNLSREGTLMKVKSIKESHPVKTNNILSSLEKSTTFHEPLGDLSVNKLSNRASKYSRFKVPSFEIKRTNSVLSPRNQYDDIFDDVIKGPPTIRSQGMKTLPSMDRDDVKRILASKKAISGDEYTRFKKVGGVTNFALSVPEFQYDKLQQQASICDTSFDSTTKTVNPFPVLATEPQIAPFNINSKDLLVYESDYSEDNILDKFLKLTSEVNQEENSSESYIQNRMPSPQLRLSPELRPIDEAGKNIIPSESSVVIKKEQGYEIRKDQKLQTPDGSPRRSSKIKISSPIKFVKTKAGIKAVSGQLPSVENESSNPKVASANSTFDFGNALKDVKISDSEDIKGTSHYRQLIENPKLRSSPQKATEPEINDSSIYSEASMPKEKNNLHKHVPKLSTITVPTLDESQISTETDIKVENLSKDVMNEDSKNELHEKLDSKDKVRTFERGRLFFRIMGLKDIDLPDIPQHKASFSITIDNGIHCMKTSNYILDSNKVDINKEFELVADKSLEFIVTMKAIYEKPRGNLVEVKERKVVKPKNRISRIFGGKEIITTTKFVSKNVEDSWAKRVARDGSFARCYLDIDQYENDITGVARNFNINCYNEWETLTNNGTDKKRQPYIIGKLEVKMLFIPRSQEKEILPKSIKSAYESLQDFCQEVSQTYEGYMYQEGGDCDILKRRYFKLLGTSLIAHNEVNHKSRAKINLSKVVEVIYLNAADVHDHSKKYRNFSDGVLLMNSFKIRFANGEAINFGASTEEEKMHWINLIENIIYRNKFRKQHWVQVMMEKNKS